MKEIPVSVGKTYAVTTAGSCTVTDADGRELCTAESGSQSYFTANGHSVTLSDDAATVTQVNFKQALAALALLGGGDKLPAGYTRLEFLESTGAQYIKTTFKPNKLSSLSRWKVISRKTGQILGWYRGSNNKYTILNESNLEGTGIAVEINTPAYSYARSINDRPIGFVAEVEINADREYIRINDNKYACPGVATGFSDEVSGSINLFSQGGTWSDVSLAQARVMLIRFWRDEVELANFMPALDPTGTPCLFDLVSRKPFYNAGTGDFTYPGKETTATTYSLRRPRMYAQMTEHGIRRLYRVPRGYTGTPEEYAVQNGFKLLVETPQPEEGYWTPVWHEREDCIELEWVETEPPEEELLTKA